MNLPNTNGEEQWTKLMTLQRRHETSGVIMCQVETDPEEKSTR